MQGVCGSPAGATTSEGYKLARPGASAFSPVGWPRGGAEAPAGSAAVFALATKGREHPGSRILRIVRVSSRVGPIPHGGRRLAWAVAAVALLAAAPAPCAASQILVVDFDAGALKAIDATGSTTASIAASGLRYMATAPGGAIYASGTGLVRRYGYDGAAFSLVQSASAPYVLNGIAVGPDGHAYAGAYNSGQVDRFDPVTLADTGSVLSGLGAYQGEMVAFGPSDDYLYVSMRPSSSIAVYNVSSPFAPSLVTTLTSGLGSNPFSLAFGPDGALYVGDVGDKTIRRWNGTTFASFATLAGHAGSGEQPYSLLFANGELVVATVGSQSLYRFEAATGTYISSFALGFTPFGLAAYDVQVPEPASTALAAVAALAALRRRRPAGAPAPLAAL